MTAHTPTMHSLYVGTDRTTAAAWKLDSNIAYDFWLPVIGPTAMVLALSLERKVARSALLATKDVAASLGVAPTKLVYSCQRLARFGLATMTGPLDGRGDLVLRTNWPRPLPHYLPLALRPHLEAMA